MSFQVRLLPIRRKYLLKIICTLFIGQIIQVKMHMKLLLSYAFIFCIFITGHIIFEHYKIRNANICFQERITCQRYHIQPRQQHCRTRSPLFGRAHQRTESRCLRQETQNFCKLKALQKNWQPTNFVSKPPKSPVLMWHRLVNQMHQTIDKYLFGC